MNLDDFNPFNSSIVSSSLDGGLSSGGNVELSTIDVKSKKGQLLTKRYLTEKDSYVTGFFYATVESVPPSFIDFMVEYYPTGNWNEDNIIDIFSSSITEVQLPAETLKTLQFNGKSGHSVTTPLFSQKGNTITIQFLADQDMKITSLLMGWYDYISKVNDSRYTVQGDFLNKLLNSHESTSNIYGMNFYYGTLLPDMTTLTFAFAAEGLFPTTMPINDMNNSLGQSDVLRHSVTFSVDYYDFWVKSRSDTYWIKSMLSGKISELRGESDFKFSYEEDTPPSAEDKFSRYAYENKDTKLTDYNQKQEFSLAHQNTLDGNAQDRFMPPRNYDDMKLKL